MSTYKDNNNHNNHNSNMNTIDQKKFLDECIFVVKEQSFYMKQALVSTQKVLKK